MTTRPSGRARVAAQNTAKTLGLDHRAGSRGLWAGDELVAETLVWPFRVVVGDVLAKRTLEVALPEEDHLVETLGHPLKRRY